MFYSEELSIHSPALKMPYHIRSMIASCRLLLDRFGDTTQPMLPLCSMRGYCSWVRQPPLVLQMSRLSYRSIYECEHECMSGASNRCGPSTRSVRSDIGACPRLGTRDGEVHRNFLDCLKTNLLAFVCPLRMQPTSIVRAGSMNTRIAQGQRCPSGGCLLSHF